MTIESRTVVGILALSLVQAANAEKEGGDLRSAVQNPISSLISVPFKFSFDYGADIYSI